jgi:hypothetical protein
VSDCAWCRNASIRLEMNNGLTNASHSILETDRQMRFNVG